MVTATSRDTLTSAKVIIDQLLTDISILYLILYLARAADKITAKESPTPVLLNPSEEGRGILNFIFPKLPYKLNLFLPKHIVMKTLKSTLRVE